MRGLTGLIGPGPMAAAVTLVVAAGIVVSAVAGRERLRADWPGSLPALCLPWLILPPAILLIGSLITPLYTLRYVLLCIPAIALLAGAGLAAIGWIAGTAALAVITLLGGPGAAGRARPERARGQRQAGGPDRGRAHAAGGRGAGVQGGELRRRPTRSVSAT